MRSSSLEGSGYLAIVADLVGENHILLQYSSRSSSGAMSSCGLGFIEQSDLAREYTFGMIGCCGGVMILRTYDAS
jgi:hypothetical protein